MSGHRRTRARPATVAAESVLGVLAAYHVVLAAAAWQARWSGGDRTTLPRVARHRFAVLVPAHDEERLLGSTLKSLLALDYPEELFDVHVVADHCSDRTADVARSCGVAVHEHEDPRPAGKGPALQWLLDRLASEGNVYDAAVFVDADTIVDPRFLRVADAHLAVGASVIQSYYSVRDVGSSPAVGLRAAALAARHYLRPLGRSRLGGTAGLHGNGMVLTIEVLGRHRWSSHLTEDIELQVLLLLDGTKVVFAPDAVVEAEMPVTLDAARTQHERWERGRLELARRFVPPLVGRAVLGGPAGRVAYADAVLDQVVPPLSIVAAGSSALALTSVARACWRPDPPAVRHAAIAVALVGAEAAYVVSALRLARVPLSVYRSLLGAPRLVAWKARLWLRMLARDRGVDWVRTARNEATTA